MSVGSFLSSAGRSVGSLSSAGRSGGCFQSSLLAELALDRLAAAGARAFLPRRVPPGDGGLALGQLWVAAHGGYTAPGRRTS